MTAGNYFARCAALKHFPGNWFERCLDFLELAAFSAFATMAKVQVLNVAVLDNPSPFGNPFQFEITFECMEDLSEGRYTHIQSSRGIVQFTV